MVSDSPYSMRRPSSVRRKSSRSSAMAQSNHNGSTGADDEGLMRQTAESFVQQELPLVDEGKAGFAGTCIHAVNGIELVTDAAGVVYWPSEQTLLVADLHLEKGSSFARRGSLLPPYDTMATLNRLMQCLEKWMPRRVIALGDSFHDAKASERLSGQSRSVLTQCMSARDWVWITGNHDPEPPEGLMGTVIDELKIGKLTLRHEPQVEGAMGEIAGHLHPKARIVRRGRSVRRSCFAASRSRMILPSFGAYTGGLNVLDPAFADLFDGRNFHALMRGDNQVYRIPGSELR